MSWPWTIWMVQLLVLSHVVVDKTRAEVEASMQPHKIYVEEDMSFRVLCTLTDGGQSGITSADLAFRWNDSDMIPDNYVQRPNATTAVLLLPRVGREYHRSYLHCLNKDDDELLDAIFTLVGHKPLPIGNINVLANNWENLTISWSKKVNPVFTTRGNAYWKLGGVSSFTKCENLQVNKEDVLENSSCWVDLRSLELTSNSFFIIKINSSNALGKLATPEKIYYVHDINKPAAVKSVRSLSRSTDWLQLTWESPAVNRSLIYEIQVSCPHIEQKQVKVGPTTDRVIIQNITGLEPGMKCSFKITSTSGIPGSLWSDPVRIRERLKDTVPSELPETTRSGFDVNVIDETVRHITIYWKPLRYSGGHITEYKVTAISMGSGTPSSAYSVKLPPETTMYTIKNQDLDKTYNISVSARTSAGYNPSLKPREPIIVQPQALLQPELENVTAIVMDENTTEIQWKPIPGAEYVGYWCETKRSRCDGAIKWEKDISSPWKVIQQTSDSKRHFGVALDIADSSGIQWADCNYDIKEKSSPPVIESVDVKERSMSLELRPFTKCPAKSGFVYAYHIHYCPVTGQHCSGRVQNFTVLKTGAVTGASVAGLHDGTTYKVWAYSVTVAGELKPPDPGSRGVQVTTLAGARSFIVTKPGKATVIGLCILLALILFIIGVVCCCRKCREGCKRRWNILIKQPDQYPPSEIVNEEPPIKGYAVPYYNFTDKDTSPEKEVRHPPQPRRAPPALPARPSQYQNDSGMGSLIFGPDSSPGVIPTSDIHFPNPAFAPGGSPEDVEGQNVLNTLKCFPGEEERSSGDHFGPFAKEDAPAYRYAPARLVLDGDMEQAPLADMGILMREGKGETNQPSSVKPGLLLLDNPRAPGGNPTTSSSSCSSSSDTGDRDEEAEEEDVSTDDQDVSDASAGYKSVLFSDKSSRPLLSATPVNPAPTASAPGPAAPRPAWSFDLTGPTGPLLTLEQQQPRLTLEDSELLVSGMEGGGSGGVRPPTPPDGREDPQGEEEGEGANSDDYGYAPTPCVLRL